MQRESMAIDVAIVGAGPAGLATACRLLQKAQAAKQEITVCVLEKGSEVGAHILSGAVFEPAVLEELFPNWKEEGAPLRTKVEKDEVYYLPNEDSSLKFPNFIVPNSMQNHGNFIISLGNLCRWLGEKATELGAEIFPGFAAAEILYNEDGSVKGVATGDMGLDADGNQKPSYEPGFEFHAKYTIFAEGCRGHLGKEIINKYALDADCDPQHYGIGIKEVWEVPSDQHNEGVVVHTAGYPMVRNSEAASSGGFLYHTEDNKVSLGLVMDLSYSNPHISPFDEFQKFKHHPVVKNVIADGKRLSYGARALVKGGLNSLPEMSFPGGLLIGCDAGTLNAAKIKGSHTAMQSGILAADSILDGLTSDDSPAELVGFNQRFKNSALYKELHSARNFTAGFHKFGFWLGSALAFIEQNIFFGRFPITLHDKSKDHCQLKPASECPQINYPKPDGKISFDKLSSVFLSNTNHAEDQPCHLQLKDCSVPLEVNLPKYDEPAQRYCPAGVYEVVESESGDKKFVINSQNCVHCKTCDIKDPSQNINWVVPEGGGGPNYSSM